MEDPGARRLTLEQYFALEAIAPDRLEFRDGFAIALALPTKNHARIAGNLTTDIGPIVRARGCDYFSGDAKIVTPGGDRLIPDFLVTCDERDLRDGDERGEAVVRHPWLVIEILSPASAADDTTYKLDAYQTIPELMQYVVIDSRRRAIRVYERNANGRFESVGLVDRLVVSNAIERGLTLENIYRDTTVPYVGERSARP